MVASGNLGHRYVFDSCSQAGLHRLAHAHYELSAARVDNQCMLISVLMSEDYLIETATQAINCYLMSLNVSSMPIEEVKISIFAAVHISESLAVALKPEDTMRLISSSVSHFECFLQRVHMAEANLVT
eukprot:101845-Amphidinium_carterae.1